MSNLASALPNFTHYQAAGVTPVRLLLAYAFLALGPTQAGAATLDWGATLRTRFESKQDFDFDNSSQDYLLTQARLRLEVEGSAGNFLIELQDARIGGESRSEAPPINEDTAPNVFADRLDLHQAYWEYSSNNSRIRVGRQKLNLGDNRLVASLEWVNTARVHDGVRLTVGNAETRSIDAFATALVAVKPDRFNDQASVGNRYLDSQFHGAFVTDRASLPGAELQYWYFYRENDDFGDRTHTVGLRFSRAIGSWHPELQFAYQRGDFAGEDHTAWMTHLGIGRDLRKGQLEAAYNRASGDRNRSDSKHQTFDNLYPLNHPYYGNMDLFSLQNMRNMELAYSLNIAGNLTVRFGLNEFWLAERDSDAWYNAGLGQILPGAVGVASHVGREIDVTIGKSLIADRLRLTAGVSTFFAGDYLADFGLTHDARFFFAGIAYSTR